jgi:hypothetical protein
MAKTVVVYTCAHSDPAVDNSRFDWLGEFLYDLRPDMVFDLGDFWDMRSLNTYDTRNPQAYIAQNYQRDVEHGNEAQDRIRRKFRFMKRKKPTFIGFEGNHENRIKKAISLDPRIEGDRFGVSFSHLNTDLWYDTYHPYVDSAPSLANYDGVLYGHYVGTGAYGHAMHTKHHAASLIDKLAHSATVGHSHKLHYYRKADARPSPLNGLVAGCFKGANEPWAGQANNEWSKGVVIKRELSNGDYDFQWVSMKALRKQYGA